MLPGLIYHCQAQEVIGGNWDYSEVILTDTATPWIARVIDQKHCGSAELQAAQQLNLQSEVIQHRVDQGLFCHDQVSLGKYLAFFNL